MKKKITMLVGLLFILVIFWGCQEDVVEPVVPAASYTIQVKQNGPGTVIPSGVITALKGETLALTVSNEIGIVSKATLEDGTELSLKNGKYYISVSSNATVNVEFEKTPKWQLMQNDWITTSWKITNYLNPSKVETIAPPKVLILHFEEDSIYQTEVPSGKLVGNMPYKIKGDSISIGKGTGIRFKKITELNDSIFSYKGISEYYDFETGKMDPSKNGTLEIVTKKVTK